MVRDRRVHRRDARLKREYQEFLQNPVPFCGAQPTETNIAIWHFNIMVPTLGQTRFHFTVSFPEEYPDKAPKIRNMTFIKHPNVFGDYICLDILTMSEATKNTPFRGWTSAYTISSLLIQLQSFLFEAIGKVEKHNKTKMIDEAKAYKCASCGHDGSRKDLACPPILCRPILGEKLKKHRLALENSSRNRRGREEPYYLALLDNVVQSVLYTMLDESTLASVRNVMWHDTEAIDLAFTKRLYKCFYTLKGVEDPKVVIGIGAKKFIMDRVSRKTRVRKPALQQLHCSFDFISHEAYKMGVRNNVWKDRDFDWFIPLYINKSHGKLALPLAEKCILNLWNSRNLDGFHRKVNGEMILNTLGKMMNTTVVNIMKTVEDLEAGELQMFDSIKALEGYTSIHHLLLAFAEKYPDIKIAATARVKRFIEDPVMRDKEVTPDIGELLIDLAVSDYSWDDFSPFWIEECFVRNARWILAKHPNLLEKESVSSCVRLTQSFQATRTGARLAMFQRFFITEVASPYRLKGNPDKNMILLSEYNKRLGMPAKRMAKELQDHSREVIACTNWWDYFALVNFCPPSCAHLAAWLRNAMDVSSIKKYHDRRKIMRYTEHWKTLPSQTHQMNHLNCICARDLYQLPEGCQVLAGGPKPKLMVKKKMKIDICFVLDCTGSMSSWIGEAKHSIQSIIQTVSQKCKSEVRFAIAGYRDHHSQGDGNDKYVVRKFDFTSDASEAKKNVKQFSAHGGADYPEAMCSAMQAAANMSWNRDGHQILITIADAPPHGLVSNGDDYPEGSPDGTDSLRIAHTMKQNGIVIYTVDCGHEDGVRQSFFHALARITGGYAMDLSDAKVLPKVVLTACMEEAAYGKLGKRIAPLYEYCLENHPNGRFEQHCQAVFSECKAKKIQMESALPADNYSAHEEAQVSSIAFCRDLKQAKAIAQDDYFFTIDRTTKLCSYAERPVSLAQITKCMKRMDNIMAKRRLMKEGCMYKSAQRFSKEAFKTRWTKFRKTRNLRHKFAPWGTIKPEDRKELRKIPDGRDLQSVLTKPKKKVPVKRNFTPNLVGKEVEILRGKNWRKVKVMKLIRDRKVEVSVNGVKLSINDSTKWRKVEAKNPFAFLDDDEDETPAAPGVEESIATNTTVPEEEEPVAVPEPKPVAVPAPLTEADIASELDEISGAPEPVRRRRVAPAPARRPTTAPVPATRPTTAPAPATRPTAAPAPATRPTAAPAPATKPTTAPTPTMTPPRPSRARTMAPIGTKVETSVPKEVVATEPKNTTVEPPKFVPVDHDYKIGEWVQMQMDLTQPWMTGTVQRLEPNLLIQVDGKGVGYRFLYVQPYPMKEYICKSNLYLYPCSHPNRRTERLGTIEAGIEVKVVRFDGDWAQIQEPKQGWIKAKNNSRRLIVDLSLIINEVKPTIMVSNIPEDCTAKDLAFKCKFAGFPPKHIRCGKDGSGKKVAQIVFEKHGAADCILTLGLSHFDEVMEITWLQEYLEYREVAL